MRAAFIVGLALLACIVPAKAQHDDRYPAARSEQVRLVRHIVRKIIVHRVARRVVHRYRQRHPQQPKPKPGAVNPLSYVAGTIVGGRPAGCPHQFCGCGASLHLFGRIIPALNLAANWLRFPRSSPAPDMVAARRGHVFVLKQHIRGNVWLAYDANSGGHRTRIHPRSLAGYTVVNPHGRHQG